VDIFCNEAKNIHKAVKILVEKHHGKVPDNMEDLMSLPGIGRKNCNVSYFIKTLSGKVREYRLTLT